jgi:predicted nucleic acid-binding protein
MNIVDSSGWLEYFADGPKASSFEKPLQDLEDLIVPTICLFEVFKVVLRERSENDALQAVALMKQGKVVDLSAEIALEAAKISHDYKIPMADSIVLATAWNWGATIWTQDSDFAKLDRVKYFPKKNS